jgi:hypothetical protein
VGTARVDEFPAKCNRRIRAQRKYRSRYTPAGTPPATYFRYTACLPALRESPRTSLGPWIAERERRRACLSGALPYQCRNRTLRASSRKTLPPPDPAATQSSVPQAGGVTGDVPGLLAASLPADRTKVAYERYTENIRANGPPLVLSSRRTRLPRPASQPHLCIRCGWIAL